MKSSATPAWFSAATVSPPPATATSLPALTRLAAALATATVAASKGGSSKAPNGPFQTSVFGLRPACSTTSATLSGPTSRIISSASTLADRHDAVAGMGLELAGDQRIDRQQDLAAGGLGLLHDLAGGVDEVLLAERLADIDAARGEEGVGHAAADDEDVDLLHEVAEQVELGRDLGAADDRHDRAGAGCRGRRTAPRARPAWCGRHRPAAHGRGPRSRHGRGGRPRRRR